MAWLDRRRKGTMGRKKSWLDKRRKGTMGRKKYKIKPYQAISKVIGFPESMYTKLSYNQTTTFAGITGSQVYRGNSVFDPDFTGAGNQPNYFDNYAAIYQKYRVLGSKIVVRILNASATIASRIALLSSDTSTPPTNVMNTVGNPFARQSLLGTTTSSKSITTLSSYQTTRRINGKSRVAISASDQYEAAVTGNPADVWFWIIQTEDVGLSANQNLIVDTKIVYYVQFSDKLNANLS